MESVSLWEKSFRNPEPGSVWRPMTSEPGGISGGSQQFQDFSWEAHDIFHGETAQNLRSQGLGGVKGGRDEAWLLDGVIEQWYRLTP